MLTIEKIDTTSKSQVRRFTRLPFQFYQDTPQWVPPILVDHESQLNRQKHPFYEHSDGEYFIAVQDGKDVGRLGVLENRRFNDYHAARKAQFYFFECADDLETAGALFNRAFEWAQARKLDTVVGPKGLGPLDGYGMLVEGFAYRQLMTMMNYNQPYLPKLVEALGFTKEVDFVSCYLGADVIGLPERVHNIAERVAQRGSIEVQRFTSKRQLAAWAPRIGAAYNKAMVNNWEYYPLTEREVSYVVENILTVADPRLIKVLSSGDEVVGYLFAFPDISAAIQRNHGRLLPLGLPDILIEMRRTKWVAINGMGILPQFQGRGGNAMLYSEMEKTIREFKFAHADLTQVAETATQMRSDLANLGGIAYKNHRVYTRSI